MRLHFDRVHETVHTRTLANGLRISYLEKPGFSKCFAMLATDFGSCDACFTAEGRRWQLPAGVAHFLEHKMFEDEDGNALQKFGATGASPNAFTSRTMTAYHFSCTERFWENLEILLKFVFTPYFTEENVAKERGIIAQEIGMLDDTPGWRVYGGLYEGLYREHPVRISIAGSCESIAEITPELLYACHRTFYSPANMALAICGTVDFDRLCEVAERLTPPSSPEPPQRDYGIRSAAVYQREVVHRMQVSQPQALLGFRDTPLAEGESWLRRLLLGDLCRRLLSGPASPLYARLFEQRLITQGYSSEYSIFPEAAAAIFGGETRDPHALRAALEDEVRRCAEGVSEESFVRTLRALHGNCLRVCDDPATYVRRELSALFRGEHYAAFAEYLDGFTQEEASACFARWTESSQSLVLPLSADESSNTKGNAQ